MDVTTQREAFNATAAKIQKAFDSYLENKQVIKQEFEPVARELFGMLLESVKRKRSLPLEITIDIEPENDPIKIYLTAIGLNKSKDSILLYHTENGEEVVSDINTFGKTRSTKIMLDILEQL